MPSHPYFGMGLIAVTINEQGSHVGLLYRFNDDEVPTFLHLAWDHDLQSKPVRSNFKSQYCIVPLMPDRPMRAKQVAHFCQTVAEANFDGIAYSFTTPFDFFDSKGLQVGGDVPVGLTCASFVISVLDKAGINLVRRGDWKAHADDKAFFDWVIRSLKGKEPRIPKAKRAGHVQALERQINNGAIRYLPLEVAGASTSRDKWPTTFADAEELGGLLKLHLKRGDEVPLYLRDA